MKFRSISKGTLGWVFALSVTIFLITMWGRALVIDTEGLGETLSPMASSSLVVNAFSSWLGSEMAEAGADPSTVDSAVGDAMTDPAITAALDRLVFEFVMAAGAPRGGRTSVDIAGILQPASSAIANAVARSTGGDVAADTVSRAIDRLDPIVVRPVDSAPQIGPGSPVAGRLGTSAVLATMVIGLAGWGMVKMSEDRLGAIKDLLTRVAMGALSFAVILRIGAWVLSPTGGRAPISETASGLFQSKWLVPMVVGLVCAAIALGLWWYRRYQGSGAEADSEDEGRRDPEAGAVTIETAVVGDATQD